MNCPVCQCRNVREVMSLYDDRYGYPGLFLLQVCVNCGHQFLNADFSLEQVAGLYTDFYPRKAFNIGQYRPHTRRHGVAAWLDGANSAAFRWVPEGVRVLDVGCGYGESLGYHVARGCDVYGVEADENIRCVAEKYGYKVHIGLFDDGLYEHEFFDCVTMDQVLEHIADPMAALSGAARILKPGGRLILSTPNANGWGAKIFGRRWINWHAPYHLQFFSRKSLRIAAQHAGFDLLRIETITNSEWLYFQWIHLLLFPQMAKPSRLWSFDMQGASFLQKAGVKLVTFLHKSKLNHLITRFFDSVSLGDNYVFVLGKK